MSNYTLVTDLNSGNTVQQNTPMQPPPQMQMPVNKQGDQFEMLKKFLQEEDDDEKIEDEEDEDSVINWSHVYGIIIILLLAIIIFFLYKIHLDIHSNTTSTI